MLTQVIPAAESSSGQRCHRILIVDDDPIARGNYLRFLRADGPRSYTAVEAGTARDGIRLLLEETFDCLVLDYQLPGTNGLAVLESLRVSNSGGPDIPVIMMTGHGSEQVAVAAMKLGVADYLPKEGLTAGAFQRAMANAVDIYRLRNALRHRNERLGQLNDELTLKTSELQRFYQTVSHELKTPLTAVREFVSLVRDGVAGETERQEFLAHALNGCDLMALQVNELLEVARCDADRLPLTLRAVQIRKCCEFSLAAVRHLAIAKDIEVSVTLAPSLPMALADEARVIQVLTNLLTNAIKFTGPGGRVDVRAMPAAGAPDRIIVEVQDTGCGIAAAHIPHLCERLFQVPESHQSASEGGLGLGLYIAKELVERQGGALTIDSTPGIGSIFRFSLPSEVGQTRTSAAA
jgi:signal transduction histidine kinase